MIIKENFKELKRLTNELRDEYSEQVQDVSISFTVNTYSEQVSAWIYLNLGADNCKTFPLYYDAISQMNTYDNLYKYLKLAIEFNLKGE